MRTVLKILLFFLLMPGIANADAPRRVLCTTFPVYLLTRLVADGSPGLAVEKLLPADLGCPHDYALTPGNLRRLAAADAIVMNGLGMEAFLTPVLDRFPQLKRIDAGGEPAASGEVHVHVHGATDDHRHAAAGDPHIFASPRQAAGMVARIVEGLSGLDPAGGEHYRTRGRETIQRLEKLADRFAALARRAVNPRIVTTHTAFSHLAADSGFTIVAMIQQEPGRDPAAAEMLARMREIRAHSPAAIFSEPQYGDRMARTLAQETGLPTACLDPLASGPEAADGEYYFEKMEENLAVLERLLVPAGGKK